MRGALLLAAVFGIAGIAVTMWLLGESVTSLARIPLSAFTIGVALVVVNYLAGAHRLWLLMRYAGEKITFIQGLRAYAVGLFSAAASPGSAGQAPAVVLSLTHDGVSASRAWSANVYVWALDLSFLAWSLPISLLVLGRGAQLISLPRIEVTALLFAIGAAALIWVLQFRLNWLTIALNEIFRLRPLRRWQLSVRSFGMRVHEASGMIRSVDLPGRLWLHVLTVTIYLSTLVTFYVMVSSLNPNATLLVTLAAAQVPMVLATFFPTPGGAGLLEVFTGSILRVGTISTVTSYSGDLEFAPGEEVLSRSGTVAAAIVGWRVLTFYSRYIIGPIFGGASLWRRRVGESVGRMSEGGR